MQTKTKRPIQRGRSFRLFNFAVLAQKVYCQTEQQ